MELSREDVKTYSATRFIEFNLDEEIFVVDLLKVREVIIPPAIVPLPDSPAFVMGVMNLRGLVLTVVDLAKILKVSSKVTSEERAIIIFDLGDRLIGAKVDSVSRVVSVNREQIKEVPKGDALTIERFLRGVVHLQNQISFWLDVDELLAQAPSPEGK